MVVVLGRTAHVDHRVERMRSSEDLAAWQVKSSVGCVGLRHGEVVPIIGTVPQLAQAGRIVDGGVLIGATGLEQQYAPSGVHKATADDCSAGAATHHDDIGSFFHGTTVPRRPAHHHAERLSVHSEPSGVQPETTALGP